VGAAPSRTAARPRFRPAIAARRRGRARGGPGRPVRRPEGVDRRRAPLPASRSRSVAASSTRPHPGGVVSGKRVLVTGATGYIGGRLAPRLLEAGYRVRVLARSPDKLRDVPWADDVEI